MAKTQEAELLRREKISKARIAKKESSGFLNSPDARRKMSAAKIGKPLSEEHCEKISRALSGKIPKNFSDAIAKAHAAPKKKGLEHPSWKGDNVGYGGLHRWVRKELGTPSICESCGTRSAKRYEWANISLEYKRQLSDWKRLCVSCHRKEGYRNGEYVVWNKGINKTELKET